MSHANDYSYRKHDGVIFRFRPGESLQVLHPDGRWHVYNSSEAYRDWYEGTPIKPEEVAQAQQPAIA